MIFLGLLSFLFFIYSILFCMNFINLSFQQEGYVLHIYCQNSLLEYYREQHHYVDDSGFDLCLPHDIEINEKQIIDLKVKAMMTYNGKASPFFIFSRSSIAKSPVFLLNSVGIIDKNYRGNLKIALYNTAMTQIKLKKNACFVQACAPNLEPFTVKFCDSLPLTQTERGENGFGSSGKYR